MQNIIRNAVFLIVIFFSLVKLPSANAMDYFLNINFGKVKPSESLSLTQPIPMAFPPEKVDGIQIEVTGPLSGVNEKQTIPVGRIRFLLNDQSFQLANSTVTINFADRIKTADQLNLALELKISPEDRADHYTGKLTLRTWVNGNEGKQWQHVVVVKIATEIQPWIKMQCETNQIVLDQMDFSAANLANRQPVQLRIASNSNWVLTCNLNGSDCGIHPTIKILSVRNSQLQILNQNANVTADRKNLVLGSATGTSAAYWIDLLLGIEINEYTKYPTKTYTIPLQFTALLWDGKAAIP
jgi:hypothetical protein